MIIKGYAFSMLYGLLCLALAFICYKLGMPKKYSRKLVHILVGFEWVILYHYFGAGLHFLSVCIFFTLLLIVTYKGSLLPMISSEDDNSPGTVYYGVAMTGVAIVGCFVPEVMLPFGIGIFCTSVGDGMAGVVGQAIKKYNPKIYGNKTLFGSITNFVFSSLGALILSSLYGMEISLCECLMIGVLSAGVELISKGGLDNIFITWTVTALAFSFMYFPAITGYLLPILLTPFVIALVVKKNALTRFGTYAAVIVDIVVSLAFGNLGFVVLIGFFGGSIIVDKLKKRTIKQGRADEAAKGDTRDAIQVLANGFVASACAVAFILSEGNPIFAVGFVAAMAEAFADTAASGIGAFSKNTFDLFRWKKTGSGLSGGMSFIGTLASLVAAIILPLIAMLMSRGAFNFKYVIIASVAAFLGTIFDSLLGSLFQVKYKCRVCSRLTEKHTHCDTETAYESGLKFVDNDVVNITSGFFATVISIVLVLLL